MIWYHWNIESTTLVVNGKNSTGSQQCEYQILIVCAVRRWLHCYMFHDHQPRKPVKEVWWNSRECFSGIISKNFAKIISKMSKNHSSIFYFRSSFFQDQIDGHKKSVDFSNLDAPASDYVEAFLRERKKAELKDAKHTFTYEWSMNMCNR